MSKENAKETKTQILETEAEKIRLRDAILLEKVNDMIESLEIELKILKQYQAYKKEILSGNKVLIDTPLKYSDIVI
jgi:hypothetical protein